jgi:hypothetical protein
MPGFLEVGEEGDKDLDLAGSSQEGHEQWLFH